MPKNSHLTKDFRGINATNSRCSYFTVNLTRLRGSSVNRRDAYTLTAFCYQSSSARVPNWALPLFIRQQQPAPRLIVIDNSRRPLRFDNNPFGYSRNLCAHRFVGGIQDEHTRQRQTGRCLNRRCNSCSAATSVKCHRQPIFSRVATNKSLAYASLSKVPSASCVSLMSGTV